MHRVDCIGKMCRIVLSVVCLVGVWACSVRKPHRQTPRKIVTILYDHPTTPDCPTDGKPTNFRQYFAQRYNGRILWQYYNYPHKWSDTDVVDTSLFRAIYEQMAREVTDSLTMPLKNTFGLPGNYSSGTPHFGLRTPNYIILHHTAQPNTAHTLRFFARMTTEVSAHYLIGQDGSIHPIVNDHFRSWHAGKSKWGNCSNMNSSSIGIELDNNGSDSFPVPQIKSLLQLLTYLKEKYKIPSQNIIGHLDIAPVRKVDPNVFFPWQTLAENGLGMWYDDPSTIASVPLTFDPIMALRAIGYDISNPDAALSAFRQHFLQIPQQPDGPPARSKKKNKRISQKEKKIIYSLYMKYAR